MTIEYRISLQKLDVFCRVVELGSVRRASEELFVSQPVVSAHLRSLGERIGAKLFVKDGRNLALTEAGEETLRWARQVLQGRRELADRLSDLSAGRSGAVSVGASQTVGNAILTPLVVEFQRAHPQANLRLEMSAVEAALEGVADGRHDFAVVATDAALDASAFESELIAEPPLVVLASATNTTVPDVITAQDLMALPHVCPVSGQAIRRSQDHLLASIGVHTRRVVLELGTGEAIKKAVAADIGVCLLWRQAAVEELRAGSLRAITIEGVHLHDKLYLVQSAGRTFSALQQSLRDYIVSGVPGVLAS